MKAGVLTGLPAILALGALSVWMWRRGTPENPTPPGPAPASGAADAQPEPMLDEALPAYVPTPGLSGALASAGSDAFDQVVRHWVQSFGEVHPGIRFEIRSRGSATAVPALVGRART